MTTTATNTSSDTAPARAARAAGSRGKRPVRAMVEDLFDHTVSDAVTSAHAYWPAGAAGVAPGKAKKVLKAADRIRTWAAAHDLTRLADLTGDTAARMLCAVTGAKSLKAEKAREALHLHRNTLIALRGVVLITTLADRKNTNRPGGDSLAAGLPELPDRSSRKGRPLFDDEILLGRTLVEIDLLEHNNPRVIAAYLLADASVAQVPSTKATINDLDDPTNPSYVVVDNLWSDRERRDERLRVKFSKYTSAALARTLTRMNTTNTALTYTGNQPGSKGAAASLNPVLKRFLKRAGITTTEVTAQSLDLWRANRALINDGNFAAARKLNGGSTHNLLAALKVHLDDSALHTGFVTVIDNTTGETVARAKTSDVYDRI